MDPSTVPGDLAFVGPTHIRELSEFQYVELVSIEGSTAVVKLVGPDYTDDSNEGRRLSLSVERFRLRLVSPHERELWPGSFIAHPVAFVRASKEGVGEWAYGVVSGYSMTGLTPILHLVCHDGAVRHSLAPDTPVIKVDILNYALQTGGRTNPIALSPTELLAEQNSVVVSYQRRRSGLPDVVKNAMSIPLDGSEIVPLIRPNNLQLVRVRRQHIVDFKVAARSRRPDDLYIDPLPKKDRHNAAAAVVNTATPSINQRRRPRAADESDSDPGDNLDYVSDVPSNAHSSDDEDVQSIRHLHRPLTKKRRIDYSNFESDTGSDSAADEIDNSRRSNRGVVFHPSTTERRIHKAVVGGVIQVRNHNCYSKLPNSPRALSL
ncbi:hypothetical protein DVH05_014459 [Phytophthora capsici]|nr:hypothetical protein DVH05_014549 [Phytophthora capsici]KAG1699090.1 hypothetical protein DVH05_014459 [Phytophthora capsici]